MRESSLLYDLYRTGPVFGVCRQEISRFSSQIRRIWRAINNNGTRYFICVCYKRKSNSSRVAGSLWQWLIFYGCYVFV